MSEKSKASRDNRANQLNPTHDAYYRSRGHSSSSSEEQAKETAQARQDSVSKSQDKSR